MNSPETSWDRPVPAQVRQKLLEAEHRRDYETCALLSLVYAENIADGYTLTTETLMAQAQVYATLHLAAQQRATSAAVTAAQPNLFGSST